MLGHAVNDKRYSGSVELTNFPSEEGITPKSQALQIPNPYNRQSGPVSGMEWSSDGYVLAVGWQHGWAIFSVGGRCLAWGFGVEDSMDEERLRIIYNFILAIFRLFCLNF